MPTYEYRCKDCGQKTEVYQSFDDPPLEKCSNCGGHLRRVFSPVGVVFKGSGFYSTDARLGAGKDKSPANGEAKPEKSKAEGAGKAADKGGESKTKTEPSSAPARKKESESKG